MPNARVFVANRSDGMGNRLLALVNAIVLAKRFNGDFFFSWPEDKIHTLQAHAVVEKEMIFSLDFIRKHCVSNDISRLGKSKPFSFAELVDHLDESEFSGCYYIDSVDLTTLSIGITSVDYLAAFSVIKFSNEVMSVYRYAFKVELSKKYVVAIHARAGDVVYGNYRYSDRFTGMVVPFPLINRAVESVDRANQTSLFQGQVIFFGQDEALKSYSKKKYSQLMICEKISSEPFLQAFFEIFLMSRSDIIVCGSSAFSKLASVIGSVNLVSIQKLLVYGLTNNVFSLESLEADIYNSMDLLPKLQVAHSSFSMFYFLGYMLRSSQKISFLQLAIKSDNKNDFYKVVLASIFCDQNKFSEAENVLINCNGKSEPGSLWQICKPFPGGGGVKRYLESINIGAYGGGYMCNLVLAIYYFHCSQREEVDRFVSRCMQLSPTARSANMDRLKNYLNK